MAFIPEYKGIYRFILDALDEEGLARRELIEKVISAFPPASDSDSPIELVREHTAIRSSVGIVINDMEKKGVVELNERGLYVRKKDKRIAIRLDECEEEILRLVSSAPQTRNQIKEKLVDFFGTDATPSASDDNQLFTYVGQILKTLVSDGSFILSDGKYSVAPKRSAYIKNRTEMLDLKADYLSKIHSRGGEFLEYYFLNLLERYLLRFGKTIIESYVTGGSADGGIDGVIRTRDALGFVETIMIQTKNRVDTITETDVRSFYGAVCAKRGTRGIFVTIADFHPMATKLMDGIDELVGVDGAKMFAMAVDTSYGIVREGERLIIDEKII